MLQKQETIRSLLQSRGMSEVLIGSRYGDRNDQFVFVGSNTTVREAAWGGNQIHHTSGDCSKYERHGNKMVNIHCTSSYRYICEAYLD